MARLSSQRVNRKVLKKVNGETLIDLSLKKINSHLISKKYKCYYACGDKKLIKIGKKYKNFELIIRDKDSINTDQIKVAYNFVKKIKEKYILWLNPCSPFIKISTILNAIKTFQNSKIRSLTTVCKEKTWIYNSKKVSYSDNKKLSTKEIKPIYLATHNFHIYNKKFFLKGYQYFRNKKNDPYLYEMSDLESLDIDTYEDLKFVRKIKL
tara:strand:+ start:2860 stop:3486 length:627 start_codon:yes stop_codon:yes gene_type:complete